MSLRVVKLGGSLLDVPRLADRLRAWLAGQSPAATVLVAGGGVLADAIRQAQRVHVFDDPAAHRLCLDVMSVTARLMCAILPEARFCGDVGEIDRHAEGSWQICDTRRLVLAANERGDLPESWDLTSDSIAAYLTLVLEADELVLLKSTLPTSSDSVAALAAAGVVDRCFPQWMHGLDSTRRQVGKHRAGVRLVNLRDEWFAEVTLPETLAPPNAEDLR